MNGHLTSDDGYFEDFAIGQRIKHARGATVGEAEGALLAKLVMNTAQGHWNEHFSLDGWEPAGSVVFGLITASLVFGLASQDVAEHAVAEQGCSGLKFLLPVKPGDTLYAYTEILDVQPDDFDRGVVRFKHWGVNHKDQVVFEGERLVLVERRPVMRPTIPVTARTGQAEGIEL